MILNPRQIGIGPAFAIGQPRRSSTLYIDQCRAGLRSQVERRRQIPRLQLALSRQGAHQRVKRLRLRQNRGYHCGLVRVALAVAQARIQKTRREFGHRRRIRHQSQKVADPTQGIGRVINQIVKGQHQVARLIETDPHLCHVRQPQRRAFGQQPAHFVILRPPQHPRLLRLGGLGRVTQHMHHVDPVKPGRADHGQPEPQQHAQPGIFQHRQIRPVKDPVQKRHRLILQPGHKTRIGQRQRLPTVKGWRIPGPAQRRQHLFIQHNQVGMFKKALLVFLIGIDAGKAQISPQRRNRRRHRRGAGPVRSQTQDHPPCGHCAKPTIIFPQTLNFPKDIRASDKGLPTRDSSPAPAKDCPCLPYLRHSDQSDPGSVKSSLRDHAATA